MAETFDKRFDKKPKKEAGELLEIHQCIKILADEIIKKIGKEDSEHPGEAYVAEWPDPRTGARIELERDYEGDATRYFVEHFKSHKSKPGMMPTATFYMDSAINDYEVYLLDKNGHYLELNEEDPDPAKELLDLITHSPAVKANADAILQEHEEAEIQNRFQHMVGRYALEHSKILRRKIYGAFSRKTPERQEQGFLDIAKKIMLYDEKMSPDVALNAINSFYQDHLAERDKKKAA